MVRHINPTEKSRTAMAPYNFVPLPEKILTIADNDDRFVTTVGDDRRPLRRCNDRFVTRTTGATDNDVHSGWIDLTITTLTPLFIRGRAQRHKEKWDTRDSRFRPQPATTPDGTPDGTPLIPGSSLRGMLRSLVEIVSFSKIAPVTEHKLFFRTVSPDSLGDEYRNRIIRGVPPPGGFVERKGAEWFVRPASRVLSVPHDCRGFGERLGYENNPKYKPTWDLQHKECWVKIDNVGRASEVELERQDSADWIRGTIVLTGSAPKKKAEFVFLPPSADSSPLRIPNDVWKRFHDDDQISNWQEGAFPRDQPAPAARKASGHLREGEPVFYLEGEAGTALFLGRARLFRFPYDRSPSDFIPEHLRSAGLDLADAIFGRVGGEPDATIKSRVRVEDAVATAHDGKGWFEDEVIVPAILSSPKPTAFQQYLVQHGLRDPDQLLTYLNGHETQIRGHKVYWHRWSDETGLQAVRWEDREYEAQLRKLDAGDAKANTQLTIIRPVRSQVSFSGKIRFENLNDIELGALLFALRLPDGCAHRLGMARPLGLGSVQITATLNRIVRAERYRSWSETGVQEVSEPTSFLAAFERTVVAHAHQSGERFVGVEGLWSVARLDALKKMLSWSGRPPREETRYLKLQNGDIKRFEEGKEFRRRPVLPTPHGVGGGDDPWQDEALNNPPPLPPKPHQPANSRAGGRPARQERRPPAAPIPASAKRDEPHSGDPVTCRLTDRTTKTQRAVLEVIGYDAEAYLDMTSSPLPESLEPGSEIRLELRATASKGRLWKVAMIEEPKPKAPKGKGPKSGPAAGNKRK